MTRHTDRKQAQAYLGIAPDDDDQALVTVEALGARRAADQPSPEHWIVFFDPAGHPL